MKNSFTSKHTKERNRKRIFEEKNDGNKLEVSRTQFSHSHYIIELHLVDTTMTTREKHENINAWTDCGEGEGKSKKFFNTNQKSFARDG